MKSFTEGASRVVDAYPLSPMQQGMLFEWLRAPDAGLNVEQIACTLQSVDIPKLKLAWQELIKRHPALRTSFRWQGVDEPIQEVTDELHVRFHEEDLRECDSREQRRRLDTYLATDRRTGFDLAVLPLLRLGIFRLAGQRYELIWSFPHILADGRSFVILVRELLELYHALEEERSPRLAALRPFRDFIDWLNQRDVAADKGFWTKTLEGFAEPVFPDLGPAQRTASSAEYAEQALHLSPQATKALKAFVQCHELTVNTMVQGAWALLLSRYTGAADVVFGATRSCRRTALDGDVHVNDMVGLFINTVPVRVRIKPEQSVVEWLQQIRRSQIAVRQAEHAALSLIQAASSLSPGARIFETILVFENERQAVSFNAIDPRFTNFRLLEKMSFPVSLHAYGEDQLLLRFEYHQDRFGDDAVKRMLEHLETLLTQMVEDGGQRVTSLELPVGAERYQVLEQWNRTGQDYPRDVTLHELLAAQAARSPDAVALTFEGATLTYRELDARADILARVLAGRGVGPGVLVGVCLERSFELVIALIGILKAGGAYVPMDPEYPAERLAFMLRDARCPVLLAQASIADGVLASLSSLPSPDVSPADVLCVDRDWHRISTEARRAPLPTGAGPDDPAYMIYTSGSTGRPKGAVNRHRGIVNRLLWMQQEYTLTRADTVLQKTPASFDVSVWEFFWPLMAGARLALAKPGGHRDPGYLADIIRDQGVTVLHFVPSMLSVFLDRDSHALPSLRDVMCSGEALSHELQQRFFARFPIARLHNLYGPTEAAVDVTYWSCKRDDERQVVPIGRPVANTRMYVLDTGMRPVPIGVPGELYIGGVQVGAGYHGRPELTADRFVPDPFSDRPTARLYRTGDLARWLDDGVIEYLGRLDFQIKLRGFRIEVGEIESALSALDSVLQCAVVLRNDPGIESRLVAYYVPSREVTPDELRAALDRTLPPHMIPSLFVPLESLPLSPAGKLDRKGLPLPESAIAREEIVAPRDEIESRVMRIWAEVLGISNFGVRDRFNVIGGHSLAAVRVFMRIEKEFGRRLQLVTMLKHDTVEKLATLLRDASLQDWSCIVALNAPGVGIPIFCPHAQTGNVLIYQHLAHELREHHTVYGLQARGNWGTQEPQESIEEMAEYYVEEILRLRPHGPYLLFAVSLGGLIALEIALRLIDRGHEVKMLAMYDTAGPAYPRFTPYGRLVKAVREHGGISFGRLRRIFRVGPMRPWRPSTVARLGRDLLRNARDTARWWIENTQRDWLSWKFAHRNPPHALQLPANTTRFRLASRRIEARYIHKFYPGRITYFRAALQPVGVIFDPTNGWSNMSRDLKVHEVPAGHTGAMHRPRITEFAQLLKRCVDEACTSVNRAPPPAAETEYLVAAGDIA